MTLTDDDDGLYHDLVATDERTCAACPTQWEGQLHDGRHFYFRYRHGNATLAIGDTRTDVAGRADTNILYGDILDGTLTDSEYHTLFLALADQMARETTQ